MGRVFIGQAGAKLAELAHHAQLPLGDCVITNAVKCRPPSNRTPLISEIRACRPYLEAESVAYGPELVICLGLVAVKAVTGKGDIKLGDVLGGLVPQDMFQCPVYATYHPAAVLCFPHLGQDWVEHVSRALSGAAPTPHPTVLGPLTVTTPPGEFVSLDLETYPGLDPFHPDARIRMAGQSTQPGYASVIMDDKVYVPDDTWICGSNIKYDIKWMMAHWQFIPDCYMWWDTAIAERLLYPQSQERGLKSLAMKYAPEMGAYSAPIAALRAARKGWAGIRDEELVEYCGNDADASLRVALAQHARMRPEDVRIMRFMSEAIVHFAKVELRGVKVDLAYNSVLAAEMGADVDRERAVCADLLGGGNPASSPAMCRHFGLKSCDEKALRGLVRRDRTRRQEVDALLAYRKKAKLLSTYVTGVALRVDARGVLHTTYRLDGTETGRASCADPNLQNIARNPKIKRQFVPHTGYWWEGDYSQAELRLGAQMSGDTRMARLLESDFHLDMAKVVFSTQTPTDAQRTIAKTTTFRIMYGGGAEGLAGALRISLWQAQRLIAAWYRAVPTFAAWQESQVRQAQEKGYVETAFGRRYTFPAGLDWDSPLGQHYRRVAVNAPIQGTVGQICEMAQIALDKQGLDVLLQVHDSVDGQATAPYQDVLPEVQRIMQGVDTWERGMTVPLVVDVKHGPTWGDLAKWSA